MRARPPYRGTLRRQLLTAILATSALAVAAAGATLFVTEIVRSRAATQKEMLSVATLVGNRSSAALLFQDERTAQENLDALAGLDQIASACLFSAEGAVLAHYAGAAGTAAACAAQRPLAEPVFQVGMFRARVQLPVVQGEAVVGAIAIQSAPAPLAARMTAQLGSLVVALCGALAVALLLALRLQRGITAPLAQMGSVANAIVASGDYSLRAPAAGARELRALARSLNRMLLTIETQNRALAETQADTARLNDALLAQQARLEQQVAERTAALARSLQQAEAANVAKSVFLSNMSHELRTPLNAVIGFSRLMAGAAGLSDQQRDNLELINRAGNHLLGLINEVLELSKIEAGRVQLNEVATDPAALLRDVADMLRLRAREAGLDFALTLADLPAAVLVDAGRLRQILINLLGNAIKFTLHGGVTLAARATPLGARGGAPRWRIAIAVSDTGVGIAPEAQQRIFEPFTQLRTHATSAGTGLGLTITRRHLQLMGAALELRSAPGQGTTFSFALDVPVAAQAAAPAAPAGRVLGVPPAWQGCPIVVADDQADARLLLRQVLEPLGFTVALAGDGEQAVALCVQWKPALVLMDWNMPGMDGLEATRRIRALPGGQAIPVVMLTASAFDEQRAETLAAGASDFMRKPLDEAELYAVLERHLPLRLLREGGGGGDGGGGEGRGQGGGQGDEMRAVHAAQDPATFDSLPAPARLTLRQAAMELNTEDIEHALAPLAGIYPRQVAAIRHMVERYQFRELCALLAPEEPAPPDSRP